MFISNAYAQTTGATQPGLESILASPMILPMIVLVVMVIMTMRSQMKRQKEQKIMMAALAKGDEVATSGGILGKVTKVSDDYVTLEISSGTEIIVQKSAITAQLIKGTIKSL